MREVTLHTDEPASIISSQPLCRACRTARSLFLNSILYFLAHVQSAASRAAIKVTSDPLTEPHSVSSASARQTQKHLLQILKAAVIGCRSTRRDDYHHHAPAAAAAAAAPSY